MTAPDVVTQIETMHGILAYNGSQVVCACDRTWKPAEDYAAHIARSVLAALTEAGTVEWGVRRVGQAEINLVARNEKNAHDMLLGDEEVVSRLTLPWCRAE